MADFEKIAGVAVSHPNKVLFPDDGITKSELAHYYDQVSDVMLRHSTDRPDTLQRFPDGIGDAGFFQKSIEDYYPEFVARIALPNKRQPGNTTYALLQNRKTLVYFVHLDVVTHHIWLSRKRRANVPDRLVIDLDPALDDDFASVRDGARVIRERLGHAGIEPFLMTTGSRGLHVVVPLRPQHDFDEVRRVGVRFVDELQERHPDTLTTAVRKARRGGRLYLDVARNAYGQTAVAPYAVRARPGAPVATPICWDELDDERLDAQRFHLRNVVARLANVGDPWRYINRHRYALATLERAVAG